MDAELEWEPRSRFKVVDLTGDRRVGCQHEHRKFGFADFGVSWAFIFVEDGFRALRQRLGVGGKARGHIDAKSLERAFGFALFEDVFLGVQFNGSDAVRRMTRSLRELFPRAFFNFFVGARAGLARSRFEAGFRHAESSGLGGRGKRRGEHGRACQNPEQHCETSSVPHPHPSSETNWTSEKGYPLLQVLIINPNKGNTNALPPGQPGATNALPEDHRRRRRGVADALGLGHESNPELYLERTAPAQARVRERNLERGRFLGFAEFAVDRFEVRPAAADPSGRVGLHGDVGGVPDRLLAGDPDAR